MPDIHIPEVPDDVRATLSARAQKAGQSLEDYLRTCLIEEARQPTVAEVFERMRRDTGSRLSFEDAVDALREIRDSRDAALCECPESR